MARLSAKRKANGGHEGEEGVAYISQRRRPSVIARKRSMGSESYSEREERESQ